MNETTAKKRPEPRRPGSRGRHHGRPEVVIETAVRSSFAHLPPRARDSACWAEYRWHVERLWGG